MNKLLAISVFTIASVAYAADIPALFPDSGFLVSDGLGNVTARNDVVTFDTQSPGNLITTNGIATSRGNANRTVYADLTVVDKSVVPFSIVTNEVHGTVELPKSFSIKAYLWYWYDTPYDPYDEDNLLETVTYTLGSGTSFPYVYSPSDTPSYAPQKLEYTGMDTWMTTAPNYFSQNTRTTNAVVSTVRTSGFEIESGGKNNSGNLMQFRCVVTMVDGSSGRMVDDSTQQYEQVVTNGFPTVVDRLLLRSEGPTGYDPVLDKTWEAKFSDGHLYYVRPGP